MQPKTFALSTLHETSFLCSSAGYVQIWLFVLPGAVYQLSTPITMRGSVTRSELQLISENWEGLALSKTICFIFSTNRLSLTLTKWLFLSSTEQRRIARPPQKHNTHKSTSVHNSGMIRSSKKHMFICYKRKRFSSHKEKMLVWHKKMRCTRRGSGTWLVFASCKARQTFEMGELPRNEDVAHSANEEDFTSCSVPERIVSNTG